MPFQLLIADVALNGDIRQVVHRGIDNPITYPESLILEFIHGPATVTDVRSIGEVARGQKDERDRLIRTYGPDIVKQLFPGLVSALPEGDPNLTTFDKSPVGVADKTPANKAAAKKIAKQAADAAANAKLDLDPAAEPTPAPEPADTSSVDAGVDL